MSPRSRVLFGVLALGWAVPSLPVHAQLGSPAGPVPVELLMARRAALLEKLGTGLAVLRSADEKSIEGDYPQDSDFRQDNDFFYLTGLETPGSWLVLVADPAAPARVVLYIPPRDSMRERWTGPKLGPGPAATVLTGIADIRSARDARQEIRALLEAGLPAEGRLALHYVRHGGEKDSAFFRDLGIGRDSALLARLDRKNLRGALGGLRQVKDDDELRRLRQAIDITAEAHREVMRSARPGWWEYEIEALIEYTFRRRGAERVGFPSIVGAGANATTLHYDKSRARTEAGDLVVIDIGAEYGYYSADVTRTIPISGRFTPRQRALYDLVLATQQAAIDSVRPGITVGRLQQISRAYMREHSGELCGSVTCERYFVHGLSHWLGMDVHDVGDYAAPLRPGMVLTIEPGIYIPAERIGIRIEDDVLVTETGREVLSAGAPRTADEIERAMRR